MIAIIPARGGSKGLPNKNIKDLNGKPLIAYTIEAALKSECINKVIVSTDCDKIAEISMKFGAEVPFMRPANLATDNASSLDVLKYTIERLEKENNLDVPSFALLQPTSPLRTSQHIDEAIKLFQNKKAYAVISFCKEAHPIFWHKFIDEQGHIHEIFNSEYDNHNRQALKSTYHPNGAIYLFDKSVLEIGEYYTDKSYAYIMNRKSSVDIDTIDDFNYAEFLINNK